MANVPQIRGLTFVLIGEFNPTIFQPAWFASEGLLLHLGDRRISVNGRKALFAS
jgi:hypothetical protein